MLKSQKLEIEMSEKRQALTALVALETLTDEQRGEMDVLTKRIGQVEVERRAALTSEDAERAVAGAAFGDNEDREYRALVEGASVGEIFAATIDHRMTTGQAHELQEQLRLGANQVPLAMLRDRRRAPEIRAVTPAPANVGTQQSTIIPGVFPMACASWLGVDMPTVGVGEATYPILTTNATAENLAENTPGTETTGAFSAEVLTPSRIQAEFFYSREDRARLSGMDESLRMNLDMALADGLDKNVIAGTNGLLGGTNLTAVVQGTRNTFALYRGSLVFDRVDGKFASTTHDIKIVVGAASYADMASLYRGNSADDSALDSIMRVSGGVKVSAHVPPFASTKQDAIVRRGTLRDMVAPIWEGISLIPDEITKAKNGQIVLTAVMLHAVQIVRSAGFARVETKHA